MIDGKRDEAAWRQELDQDRGELRHHLEALRRSAGLAAATVATVTLGALLLSLLLPDSYRATARLVLQEEAPADAETTQRRLATAGTFVKSPSVLRSASERLDGTSPRELHDHTSSEVSADANVIEVSGSGRRPGEAAAIANAVAESFVEERGRSERAELARQRAALEQLLRRIARAAPTEAVPRQLRALGRRAAELRIREATAGSDVRLVEPATPPSRPSSPRPLLATVVALFASLLIAILVALGREQLSPRASGPREVGRVLGVPVLAGVPEIRRGLGGRGGTLVAAEREAFESLRNAIELATPPESQKVIVVTSGVGGEGKTTVAFRLARSLVTAGQNTLLVSGDLRRPALHRCFGLPSAPGVADLLETAISGHRLVSRSSLVEAIRVTAPAPVSEGASWLAVLPSGEPRADPAPLLRSDLVASLFDEIAELDYEWVLVDSPPLLGTVDTRVFASASDALLLVSRLKVVTVDQLLEERDQLDQLEVGALGVVVIGSRAASSAYDGRLPRPTAPRATQSTDPHRLVQESVTRDHR